METLPPGTLLQLMYLKERLAQIPAGRFVEIGPGAGNISALLLSLGWTGEAYDLERSTVETLNRRFSEEIQSGSYRAVEGDWLGAGSVRADLVISCMVIEHLDDEAERRFFDRARLTLNPGGTMVAIVPGSPAHWGIEDDIAGHMRRYSADAFSEKLEQAGWNVMHWSGLTYPVSNLLLPISNYLVRRSEAKKLSLSMLERTKQSGIRDVPMKTKFPPVLKLLLNERVLWPLHLMQKVFGRCDRALVLYVEAKPMVDQPREIN